jgi:hypothetical protein
VRQELERNRPSEPDIFCSVDLAHTAGAKALADAVVLNGGTNQRLHGCFELSRLSYFDAGRGRDVPVTSVYDSPDVTGNGQKYEDVLDLPATTKRQRY